MRHNKGIFSVVIQTIQAHILLFLMLLFTIAGTIVTGILPPLVLGEMIDTLTAGKPILFWRITCYFFLLAAAGVFDMAKESLITVFGQKVTHGLRLEMCAKLSRLPAAYMIQNEAGVTVSRFVNDVDTVESLFTSGIISMVVDACKVVSILAVIFIKSRGLGILMILVTPFLFLMTRIFQKRMLKAQLANRVAVGKVNNHVPETIKNIRMIHTFHKEAYMEKRYQEYIQESYQAMEKSNFYNAVYSPVILIISAGLVAVMMVLSARGGHMQEFFGMSVGTAVAIIAYVGKVFEPLESIGMEIQNIQSAVAGASRINEFLHEKERMLPDSQKIDIDRKCPAAELKNVSFGYEKEQEILHYYSFSVESGENVTLTGRTGAGKSTIFKLLMGLYQPWSGSVSIYGIDAAQIPECQKRSLLGYVEQSFHLIPGTVKEQITLKDDTISQEEVENAVKLTGLEETIAELKEGYETLCTPTLFSQGQMQLLSIARAVAANPKILLLDEITANLDSATEEKVLDALKAASKNRTVISISHRLYECSGGRRICMPEFADRSIASSPSRKQ